jgi:O-antigen ligase
MIDQIPQMIFGAAVAGILFFIIVRQPYIGVALTVASAPIVDLIPPIPFFSSVVPILGAITIFGFLLKKREVTGNLFLRFNILHLLAIIFIVWIYVSNPQAAWSGLDRNWILTFAQLFILMYLAGDLLDKPQKHIVLMTIFAVVSVISAYNAISRGYIGEDIDASARVGGFAAGANDAARYFVVAMVFVTFLRSKVRQPFWRLMMLVAIIITYLGVFFTVSRTGMVLLFFAQLMLFVFQHEGRQRTQLLVIFGSAFVLTLLLSNTIIDILQTIIPTITKGTDTVGLRYDLWRAGWLMWLDHPIRGVGIGMYAHNSYAYMQRLPGVMPRTLVAHNMYVQTLAETGLIGLLLFLSIIYVSFINFRKARMVEEPEITELRNVWLIVFVVMLIGGITKTDQVDKLLWMVMGVSSFFVNQIPAKQPLEIKPDEALQVKGQHERADTRWLRIDNDRS